MKTRWTAARTTVCLALAAAAMSSCADRRAASVPPSPPTPTSSPVPAAPPAPPVVVVAEPPDDLSAPVHERVARAIVRGAPMAEPGDARARDAAAVKFGRLDALLNNSDARVLWGVRDAAVPIDPLEIKAIHLDPLAWAKLYLSLFMFPGPYEVRQDGDYTVVEMSARFRSALPPGDYPHALWHSPDEWSAYAEARVVQLVFLKDRFFAAYLPEPKGPTEVKSPVWDERWHWTDGAGAAQPRVAEYGYVFSADNPHIGALAEAYGKVRVALRAQGCLACHSPDNKRNTSTLLLLGYPGQALAARHALPAVLKANAMPPGDPRHGQPRGMKNEADRAALIVLADEFEKRAEEAMLFESDARGVPRKPPAPVRERPEY